MELFGICNQSLVPIRRQPSDTSEMTNQLIYGDLLSIKDQVNSWLLIQSLHDQYEGWLDEKQVRLLTADQCQSLQKSTTRVVQSVAAMAKTSDNQTSLYLTFGSTLYQYNDGKYNNLDGVFHFDGPSTEISKTIDGNLLVNTALTFLDAPYLWGGRSIWGIDCSGLSQLCCMLNGIFLPRDAADQSAKGTPVDFIHEAQPGDLAFFDNDEGKIIHVGMVMSDHRIIHASGRVRVDVLDHQGIYQPDNKKYTHQLRLIKRVI